jgi:thiamine biosynthesis lipoprotein
MAAAEYRHRAMASEVHLVLVDAGPGPARDAIGQLDDLERRWSRFLPGSDITRLNRSPGIPVPVHPDTLGLVTAMIDGWRLTHGRYDPTVLPALVAAGYTASIDDPAAVTILPADAGGDATLGDVTVDFVDGTVTVPPGLALDPGGIGKGLAADLVVARLLDHGVAGALVGIGGDLAMAGTPPHPDGWLVTVEDPHDPATAIATLAVAAGGVGTSSTLSRRWRYDGRTNHHLIDPATGHPATTDLAAVTAVAGSGWLAEVHATAALLAGRGQALAYLQAHRVAGVVTTASGANLTTPDLASPAAAGRRIPA